MPDPSRALPTGPRAAPGQRAGRTWTYGWVYRIAIGIYAAFSFGIALVLLSLPAIVPSSPIGVTWPVYGAALAMAGFGLFGVFATIAVSRTRISLDATSLGAIVPAHHSPFLVPHFRTIDLGLSEIASVERRTEVTKRLGLSTSRESLSVVDRTGTRYGLVSATAGAIALPVDQIAAAIAAAAGVEVTDRGVVRTSAPGLYGEETSAWTEPVLDPVASDHARRAAVQTLQITGILVLLTIVLRACL